MAECKILPFYFMHIPISILTEICNILIHLGRFRKYLGRFRKEKNRIVPSYELFCYRQFCLTRGQFSQCNSLLTLCASTRADWD